MNENHSYNEEDEIEVSILETPPAAPMSSSPVNESSISINDRRQYLARIPIEIDLHITTPEQKGIARSIDVSVTGLLVHTYLELQLDERVILTILHPEEDTHACAKVMRVAETDPEQGNKYGLLILSDDATIWQGVLRRLIL
ncbi:MAG: PilZ domain-containing protein [Blastocatellia bacterium]